MISTRTLYKWAAKSLKERVSLFKRRYPDTKMNVYRLRKLYKEQNIKNKRIKLTKLPDRPTLERITIAAAELA